MMKSVTYFADLSPYSFLLNGLHDEFVEQPVAVNIGWLGAGHEFPVGEAPEWLVPGILKLVAHDLVNLTRGYHQCHLCEDPCWPPTGTEFSGEQQTLGNGEIRVRGADGTLYAAPSLIGHYVAEHAYLPPDGFIEAIREAARTGAPSSDPPAGRLSGGSSLARCDTPSRRGHAGLRLYRA